MSKIILPSTKGEKWWGFKSLRKLVRYDCVVTSEMGDEDCKKELTSAITFGIDVLNRESKY
jgi:hypothetical protein